MRREEIELNDSRCVFGALRLAHETFEEGHNIKLPTDKQT